MLAPRAKIATDTDAANVGFIEKFWIGMLTIIVPVSFDTIKNLHKSNPAQEGPVSSSSASGSTRHDDARLLLPERQQMTTPSTRRTRTKENLDKNWEAYSRERTRSDGTHLHIVSAHLSALDRALQALTSVGGCVTGVRSCCSR